MIDIAGLCASNLLVALDFDGTLAPIVDRPEDAAMRPSTRRLLAQVAQLFPCAVVSGRGEEDLRRRLGGVTVWYAVGNHFLEQPEAREEQVKAWILPLHEALSAVPGVRVENKGASLAVHYRQAAQHESAREQIAAAVARLERVRAIHGKEVVNLLPQGGPDKAAAVERLRRQLGCDAVLYAGDDASDEDVFALPPVCGVKIGEGATRAPHSLREQAEIDGLLERLVRAREQAARRQEKIPQRRGAP